MRVLLAVPPHARLRHPPETVAVHPLALGYLAAAATGDHDVLQLVPDLRAGTDPWSEIDGVLADFKPHLVGISALTATFDAALDLARRAKAIAGSTVVMGGPHVSARPVAPDGVDAVVLGEGERALLDVIAGARGVVRREPVANLDEIAFPRRDNVLWTEDVHPAFYQSIVTLRGCPYACVYCAVPSLDERKTRYRSPANVLDEIAQLVERHRIPYLFFHDSVFTLHRRRTVEILEGMIARGVAVPFCCQTRVDRVDPELLALMKRAGCHHVYYGIESGHPETLRQMRKDVPLARARQAVRDTLDAGIRASGFFMVGFPWETEDHLAATGDFATSLGLASLSLFSATPLPGTELERLWGQPAPPAVDFRAPTVNLTAMKHERYIELYQRLHARFEAYNLGPDTSIMYQKG
ncbi:MAG: B12-binding domain-containing radical SAM protein [Deltaproteobacteria bacterium]|nr:B12-binding domain-containing radical SAM protein [Deltaproteobacteria bacterium]